MNKATNENITQQPIANLMRQQARNFFVEVNGDGEYIYHWIDTSIDMLSSSKLWDLLRIAEIPGCMMDADFIGSITDELIRRSDYFDGRPLLPRH
ncbi:hypothetical protein Q8A57_06705 [Porticoccus litoralis]|uniref:Uncharacterized protein n=1 Tax=Porticoccus litoralis TaxID=434086 RepID=A0AAW8B6V3_9GAMM|nr:hypothetical protein [Porticoccus litoralis]MDP1520648.1 hypothetical protein [Porticoccus litoralis]